MSQLKAVIHSYEKQVNQLGDKVKSLENEMENKEKVVAQVCVPANTTIKN